MKTCTKCGEINTTDTKFCVRCGNDAFVSDEDVVCPKCGMSNVVESAFCIGCGAPLPEKNSKLTVMENINDSAEAKRRELALNESVSEATPTCVVCGARLRVNDVFCTNCGSVVVGGNQEKILKCRLCPKCGKPNELNSAYCSYCFTSLEGGETEDFSLDYVEAARSGEQVIKQAVLVSLSGKKRRICPNCGAINDIEQPYCEKCGYRLQVEFAKKYCLACGTENNFDAKFCTKCQYAFGGKNFAQAQSSWKCPTCGELNENDSLFCSKCGVKKPKR